jgi:hypothetical protein
MGQDDSSERTPATGMQMMPQHTAPRRYDTNVGERCDDPRDQAAARAASFMVLASTP